MNESKNKKVVFSGTYSFDNKDIYEDEGTLIRIPVIRKGLPFREKVNNKVISYFLSFSLKVQMLKEQKEID